MIVEEEEETFNFHKGSKKELTKCQQVSKIFNLTLIFNIFWMRIYREKKGSLPKWAAMLRVNNKTGYNATKKEILRAF